MEFIVGLVMTLRIMSFVIMVGWVGFVVIEAGKIIIKRNAPKTIKCLLQKVVYAFALYGVFMFLSVLLNDVKQYV